MSHEEIFSNSPKPSIDRPGSCPVTPLQSYIRDQQNLRLQRIADERKRLLLETQCDLDVATNQNEFLSKENEKLKLEINRFKVQLEDAKKKLFSMPPDLPNDEVEELKAHNRRLTYCISEKKDNEKYIKDLELELESSVQANREYASKCSALQEKVKESSAHKNALVFQVKDFQDTLQHVEGQNEELQKRVEELLRELEDLKANTQLGSNSKSSFGGSFRKSYVGGFSVADISVDEPQFSPSKLDAPGDVIGNDVILDLRENLAKINDDLEKEREYHTLLIEKNDYLESETARLEEENTSLKFQIETLERNFSKQNKDHEKVIAELNDDLKKQKESQQLNIEKCEYLKQEVSKLESENASHKSQIETLENIISKNVEANEKLIANLNSDLEKEREMRQLDIEKCKCFEQEVSKLESENARHRSQIETLEISISKNVEANEKTLTKLNDELEKERELHQLQIKNCEDLKQEKSKLESENAICKSQIETFEISITEKVKTNEELLAKLNGELEKERKLHQHAIEESENFKSELSKLENKNAVLSSQIETLERNISIQIEDKEKLVAKFHDNLDKEKTNQALEIEKCASLESQCSKLKSQITSQKSEIDLLSSKLSEAHASQETISIEKLEFVQKLSTLKDELEQACNALHLEEEKSWALQEKVATIENQGKAKEASIEELTQLLQKQTAEFEKVTSKLTNDLAAEAELLKVELKNVSSLTGQVEALQNEISSLKSLNVSANCEIRDLVKQREDLVVKFSHERDELASRFARLESENTKYKTRSTELDSMLAGAMSDVSEYKNKLEELDRSARMELIELQTQASERENSLQQKLEQLKIEKESLEAELKRAEDKSIAKLEQISFLLTSKDQELNEMKKMHADLKESSAVEVSETKKVFGEEIENLHKKIETEKCDHLRQIEIFTEEKSTFESRLATEQEARVKAESNIVELTMQTNNLNNELDNYKTKYQYLMETSELEKSEASKVTDAQTAKQIENLKCDYESKLAESFSTHQADIKTLIETYESKLSEMAKEKSKIESDLNQMSKRWDEFRVMSNDKLEEVANKTNAIEADLMNQVSFVKLERDKLAAEIQSLRLASNKQATETEALQTALDDQKKETSKIIKNAEIEIDNKVKQLEMDHKKAMQDQKARYTAKVDEIAANVKKQYQVKIEELLSKWKKDVGNKNEIIENLNQELRTLKEEVSRMTENYNIAKENLTEMIDVASDHKEVAAKYQASKGAIKKLVEDYKILENQMAEIKLVNEQLRKEVKTSSQDQQSGFKQPNIPGMKAPINTPGRTKAGRTQSDSTMPRRPPPGVGALFSTHEESGEDFSTSYLNDMKEGRCSAAAVNSWRISELARRNSMVPAHLKSSYPAETQFHPQQEFTDDDLRLSRISIHGKEDTTPDTKPSRKAAASEASPTLLRRSSRSSVYYSRQGFETVTPGSKENLRPQQSNSRSSMKQGLGQELKRKPDSDEISPRTSKRVRQTATPITPLVSVEIDMGSSSPSMAQNSPQTGSSKSTPNSKKPYSGKTPGSLRKLLSKARILTKAKVKGQDGSTPTLHVSPRKLNLRMRK